MGCKGFTACKIERKDNQWYNLQTFSTWIEQLPCIMCTSCGGAHVSDRVGMKRWTILSKDEKMKTEEMDASGRIICVGTFQQR